MCRRPRRMQSRKSLPHELHRTPNNAHKTQHKLGVAFEVRERKYIDLPRAKSESLVNILIIYTKGKSFTTKVRTNEQTNGKK